MRPLLLDEAPPVEEEVEGVRDAHHEPARVHVGEALPPEVLVGSRGQVRVEGLEDFGVQRLGEVSLPEDVREELRRAKRVRE